MEETEAEYPRVALCRKGYLDFESWRVVCNETLGGESWYKSFMPEEFRNPETSKDDYPDYYIIRPSKVTVKPDKTAIIEYDEIKIITSTKTLRDLPADTAVQRALVITDKRALGLAIKCARDQSEMRTWPLVEIDKDGEIVTKNRFLDNIVRL